MGMAWGGHKNGQIPASAMVTVRGEQFERVAGQQVVALGAAFKKRFGKDLIINDGYRPLWEQVSNWNKWVAYRDGRGPWAPLAAYYGTSNHGWGKAADFGSRVNVFGSAEKKWMDANAPKYGWHPTGNRFSRPEAWHFDYTGNPTIVAGDGHTVITEEEEDEMKPSQVHWTRKSDGKTQRALFVPGTAYWLTWQETGASIANGFARNIGTGSSTPITENMAKAMANAAAVLLPKAVSLGTVAVEVDAKDLASAVDVVLADNFAAIPGAVADEQANRMKS